MESQSKRSIKLDYEAPVSSNAKITVHIDHFGEKQEGLKITELLGEYKGKRLIKILFSLPKAAKDIFLVALDGRDIKTNLVKLSPKMFGVSSSNFTRDIKPLITNEILIRPSSYSVMDKGNKKVIIYMFNPYFILPMKDNRDKSNGYGRVFDFWKEFNKAC